MNGTVFSAFHVNFKCTKAVLSRAIAADVLLLNEVGLDPGLDHCSAHALIASLHAQKKRIIAFTSFCGGLPAPDCAENTPLLYKFSCNPRGALTATNNTARFRLAGKVRSCLKVAL
jgi:alpha-aminoadipic semialdehyde synthase